MLNHLLYTSHFHINTRPTDEATTPNTHTLAAYLNSLLVYSWDEKGSKN